uniref:CSON005384 protein n=1 Tax=Culicoides sonorensis TaxID=179676 RepID=A0A336MQC8_CULSO
MPHLSDKSDSLHSVKVDSDINMTHQDHAPIESNDDSDSDVDISSDIENSNIKSRESINFLQAKLNEHFSKEINKDGVKDLISDIFNHIMVKSFLIDEIDENQVCFLHKLLYYLIKIGLKDEKDVDIIEITLNKSNLDYRKYQNGVVLRMLKYYDRKIEPKSIKYLQWQILDGEGEKLVEFSKMFNCEDAKKFIKCIDRAIMNEKHLDDLVEAIFASGSLELLKYVLEKIKKGSGIKLMTPLVVNAVFCSLFTKISHVENFKRCFEYLLNVLSEHEINYADAEGETALHIAVDFNDDFLIRKLLEKGASINIPNNCGDYAIEKMSFAFLEELLDKQITSTPTIYLDDESTWKAINNMYKKKYDLNGYFFMNFKSFFDSFFDVLDLMKSLSESQRLCKLINHPILTTLLELHWDCFKKWIFVDNISVIFMLLAILTFVMEYTFSFGFTIRRIINYIIAVVISIVFLLEVFKNYKLFNEIIVCGSNMIKIWFRQVDIDETENKKISTYDMKTFPFYQTVTSLLLKVPLLFLIIAYALITAKENSIDKLTESNDTKLIIGVGAIYFSMNITLFIAYFNQTVAHYVIMFLHVAKNGLKFILCMFIILFGFAVSLSMLITNFPYEGGLTGSTNRTTSTWETIGISLMRTIIMSTGELETSSFNMRALISYFVFLFFIFVIPIVMFNLLNGLAIEDISVVKQEAMYWYRKTQITVLTEFQSLYFNVDDRFSCIKLPNMDISLYPQVIGYNAFIAVNPVTKEIYAMDGLEKIQRKSIGRLSKSAFMSAQEVLIRQKTCE